MTPKLILTFIALVLCLGSFWPDERGRYPLAAGVVLYILTDAFVS